MSDRRLIIALAVALALQGMAACSGADADGQNGVAGNQDEIDRRARPVQYMFEPVGDERIVIDTLLQSLARADENVDLLGGSEVYRFGTSGTGGMRYLLVSPAKVAEGHLEPRMYVGDLGAQPEISIGFRPDVHGNGSQESFRIQHVEDVDNDGWPDVSYCTWSGSDEKGRWRASGYRNGNWYSINASMPAGGRCE